MRKLAFFFLTATLWAATAPASQSSPAHKYFSDVLLTDQNGTKMRFYSDVLQGKIVIVESFFSTCTGTCPVMNATFGKLQKALGDRIGKDVFLVSITVDHENDTPAKLKEYAKRVGARPGWLFLTGSKDNVEQALQKLGLAAPTREQHKNIFIVGNEPTGLWKKVFGLAKADEIIRLVEGVANDRSAE